MYKAKIVPIKCVTAKEVIVSAYRTDDGDDVVQLQCWHKDIKGDRGLYYQAENLAPSSENLIQPLINGIGEEIATAFAKSFTF